MDLENENAAWIYGFFRAGKALYIGQSVTPSKREYFHRHKLGRILNRSRFRVIRQTTVADAGRIEHQIIQAYHKRGQALLNKACYRLPNTANQPTSPLLWIETGKRLQSIAQAARVFGCSPAAISKKLRRAISGVAELERGVTVQKL